MDFSTFFSQQPQQQRQQSYPNLTAANLQNLQQNGAFQLNPSPPTLVQHNTDQCPQNNISPLQQNNITPLPTNNLAQLQTNMFYMDPFETNSKVETGQGNDMDAYSSNSPNLAASRIAPPLPSCSKSLFRCCWQQLIPFR